MKALRKLLCWWFGCDPEWRAYDICGDAMPCRRCGAADTSYQDRVGDTRHGRLMDRLRWLRWRLLHGWRRKACPACGRHDCRIDNCDGIPF